MSLGDGIYSELADPTSLNHGLIRRSTKHSIGEDTNVNSKVAAALFTAHRIKMEEAAIEKAEMFRSLPNVSCIALSAELEDLEREFEYQIEGNEKIDKSSNGKMPSSPKRMSSIPIKSSFSLRASAELSDLINEFEHDRWYHQVYRFVEQFSRIGMFLVLLGVLAGCVAVFINFLIAQLSNEGLNIVSKFDSFNSATSNSTHSAISNSNPINGGYAAYIAYCIFLVLISTLITYFVSKQAAGSGIPEMKSILSGARLPEYLSLKTLFVKIIGLIFAVGGGLTIGQEGPFVHISCAIAYLLLLLPSFKKLGATEHSRSLILGIGCGVGISASFGAPFGGMLYAIEVTSTYYSMDNYFNTFIACVVSGFAFRWLDNVSSGDAYWVSTLQTEFHIHSSISLGDLFLFLILGIVISFSGVALIKLFKLASILRKAPISTSYNVEVSPSWMRSLVMNDWVFMIVIVFITSLLNYPRAIGDFMGLGNHSILESLFSNSRLDALTNSQTASDWASGGGVYFNLILMGFLRLILCSVSMTIPVPCGVFFPSMIIGGCFGRFWGEMSASLFSSTVPAGLFAVAGAAAMVSSVTHSISAVLIIFEVTGQLNSFYPVTLCTVAAFIMSKKFTSSIYETIIELKNLPYLPTLKEFAVGGCIANIMEPCSFRGYIPVVCDIKTMIQVLTKMSDVLFPVTLSQDNHFFVGSVSRDQLESYVIEYLDSSLKYIDSHSSFSSETDNEMRDMLIKISKTILDPLHKHVLVRPDFALDMFLTPLDNFTKIPQTLKVHYDPSPIRFLPEMSIANAHVLFILFRLQNAFVIQRGQLCGIVRRSNFVKAIQDPDSFR